ncbi:MAG: YkgJ family cysteine cluster protein [Victivallaceae bacterium]|nr:YkgJ family cysteine cluster protein [Victivallaceae bacterium]
MNSFRCVRCGNCCRWYGPVRVDASEIADISAFLELLEADFIRDHTTLTADRRGLSLLEKSDGSCEYFSEEAGCLIQPVKPRQCRDFPLKWNFPGWENECGGDKK